MPFVFSDPKEGRSQFLETLEDALSGRSVSQVRAGFAYVSLKGLRSLLHVLSELEIPTGCFHFIAGINEGITEPKALSALLEMKEVNIRAFVPGNRLGKEAIFRKPTFHPKILHFLFSDPPVGELVSISSANLTFGAIGAPARNYEAGNISLLESGCEDLKSLDAWWTAIWAESRPVDTKFIDAYATIRGEALKVNPDLLSLCEPSEDIVTAQHFWMEVGKASGMDRHQIEFPRHLASFFGRPQTARVDLTLNQGGISFPGRPLSHKTTTYGVNIWRLGMPTIRSGGEEIQERAVRFTRTNVPTTFECEVTDLGSNSMKAWFDSSNKYGHVGKTSGNNSRVYGYE